MKDRRGVTTPHRLIAVNVDETCKTFQSALKKTDPPGDDLWASGWQGPLSQSPRGLPPPNSHRGAIGF